MDFFDSSEKGFSWVSRILNYIGTGTLGFMMMLIVVDVAGRYLFNSPVKGSIEIVEYCMVVIGSLGLAWCTLLGSHAKVDLVVDRLPAKARNIIDLITHILCLFMYAIFTWQIFLEGKNMLLIYEEVSTVLEIPSYPFYFIMSLGFFTLSLAVIIKIVHLVKEVMR